MAKWFKGLRAKFLLLIVVPALALGVVCYESLSGVNRISEDLELVMREELPSAIFLGEMDGSFHTAIVWLWNAQASEDIAARTDSLNKLEHEIERFEHAQASYLQLHLNSHEAELFTPIKTNWHLAKREIHEITESIKEGRSISAQILRSRVMHFIPKMDKGFEQLDEYQNKHLEEAHRHALADEHSVYRNTVLFGLFGTLISVIFGIIFARKIASTMTGLGSSLSQSADMVAAASTEIAQASSELAQSTTEQAASLQQTASAIEELSSMVTKNSQNAQSTSSISVESHSKVEQGKQVVEDMIHSMDEINSSNVRIMEQVDRSNIQLAEIVRLIREIGSKTKVINEIVFQTKLLSFNASVEAARAGEMGKGFSVVAEEVGNLAQMSGTAAREITSMLDGSIQRVEAIVRDSKTEIEKMINEGRTKVEGGANIARECGQVLGEILESVSTVKATAEEIAVASSEQATGVAEITKAMQQLDQVTQQNSSATEQCSTSAEELSAQAESLRNSIAILQTTIDGPAVRKRLPERPKIEFTPRRLAG